MEPAPAPLRFNGCDASRSQSSALRQPVIPVNRESAAVNARARASNAIPWARGIAAERTMVPITQRATAMPNAPPAEASRVLSVTSWVIRRICTAMTAASSPSLPNWVGCPLRSNEERSAGQSTFSNARRHVADATEKLAGGYEEASEKVRRFIFVVESGYQPFRNAQNRRRTAGGLHNLKLSGVRNADAQN
jgi:hypothetical protein